MFSLDKILVVASSLALVAANPVARLEARQNIENVCLISPLPIGVALPPPSQVITCSSPDVCNPNLTIIIPVIGEVGLGICGLPTA